MVMSIFIFVFLDTSAHVPLALPCSVPARDRRSILRTRRQNCHPGQGDRKVLRPYCSPPNSGVCGEVCDRLSQLPVESKEQPQQFQGKIFIIPGKYFT